MAKTKKWEGSRPRAWRVTKIFFHFHALRAKHFPLPIRRGRAKSAKYGLTI